MQERSQRKGAVWMTAQAAVMAAASAVTMTLMSGCKPGGDVPRPLAPVEAASANPAVSATLLKQSDEVLARYRQMIVLMDGESALKPAERDAVRAVGMLLFHDMQDSMRALGETASKSTDPAGLAALSDLLDRIEQEPSWFDADRLAFKEFLTQLSQQFSTSQSIAGLKLAKRAGEDLSVLAEIENAYEQEPARHLRPFRAARHRAQAREVDRLRRQAQGPVRARPHPEGLRDHPAGSAGTSEHHGRGRRGRGLDDRGTDRPDGADIAGSGCHPRSQQAGTRVLRPPAAAQDGAADLRRRPAPALHRRDPGDPQALSGAGRVLRAGPQPGQRRRQRQGQARARQRGRQARARRRPSDRQPQLQPRRDVEVRGSTRSARKPARPRPCSTPPAATARRCSAFPTARATTRRSARSRRSSCAR